MTFRRPAADEQAGLASRLRAGASALLPGGGPESEARSRRPGVGGPESEARIRQAAWVAGAPWRVSLSLRWKDAREALGTSGRDGL